jgi:hypothetical protein
MSHDELSDGDANGTDKKEEEKKGGGKNIKVRTKNADKERVGSAIRGPLTARQTCEPAGTTTHQQIHHRHDCSETVAMSL